MSDEDTEVVPAVQPTAVYVDYNETKIQIHDVSDNVVRMETARAREASAPAKWASAAVIAIALGAFVAVVVIAFRATDPWVQGLAVLAIAGVAGYLTGPALKKILAQTAGT